MIEPIDRIYPPYTQEMDDSNKTIFYCWNCRRKLPYKDYIGRINYLPATCPICGKLSVTSNVRKKIFKIRVVKQEAKE